MLLVTNGLTQYGISLKTDEQGKVMWSQTRQVLPGNRTWLMGPMGENVYTMLDKELIQWYGFDASTGNQIWGPTTDDTNPWDCYSSGAYNGQIAQGHLYAEGIGGTIYCYDVQNGTLLWTFTTDNAGLEDYTGTNYPFYGGSIYFADGKVYACTAGRDVSMPQWKGSKIYCIDATTGEGL